MEKCGCGSFAINPARHGRDGTDLDLCDVCYWRRRGERFDYATNELRHYKQFWSAKQDKLGRLEAVFEKWARQGVLDDFGRFDFLGELLYEYNKK